MLYKSNKPPVALNTHTDRIESDQFSVCVLCDGNGHCSQSMETVNLAETPNNDVGDGKHKADRARAAANNGAQ